MVELTKEEYNNFVKQSEQLRIIKNCIKLDIFDLKRIVEAIEEAQTNE